MADGRRLQQEQLPASKTHKGNKKKKKKFGRVWFTIFEGGGVFDADSN